MSRTQPADTAGPVVRLDTLEALRTFDTPTLANAIETFDVRPRDEGFASFEIKCLFPELAPLVGFAATATFRARGFSGNVGQPALWAHAREIGHPSVIVCEDLDEPKGHGALWGEVNANIFTALGSVGAITDGCVRDLDEARAIGFQFFARGACVSHGYLRVEDVGVPVTVGGLVVHPGDLLHADQHGVLCIPPETAEPLVEAARALVGREQRLIEWVRSADFDPDRLGEMKASLH